MSLRETFSNIISVRVIQKYGKSALVQISAVFEIFSMLPVER